MKKKAFFSLSRITSTAKSTFSHNSAQAFLSRRDLDKWEESTHWNRKLRSNTNYTSINSKDIKKSRINKAVWFKQASPVASRKLDNHMLLAAVHSGKWMLIISKPRSMRLCELCFSYICESLSCSFVTFTIPKNIRLFIYFFTFKSQP